MLRGISEFPHPDDDPCVGSPLLHVVQGKPARRNTMHDLLIALAFIGMVIAPAIVAANSSAESAEDND
jgi:hypothetical protein